MNIKDLRAMDEAALAAELLQLRREQFNLRMQSATGQGAKPDQHGKVRKDIARIKTVLSERAGGKQAQVGGSIG
jgi:large subunit ribosomal protein L29